MNRQQVPNSSSEKNHSPSPGTFSRSYASFDTSMDSNRFSSTGYGAGASLDINCSLNVRLSDPHFVCTITHNYTCGSIKVTLIQFKSR